MLSSALGNPAVSNQNSMKTSLRLPNIWIMISLRIDILKGGNLFKNPKLCNKNIFYRRITFWSKFMFFVVEVFPRLGGFPKDDGCEIGLRARMSVRRFHSRWRKHFMLAENCNNKPMCQPTDISIFYPVPSGLKTSPESAPSNNKLFSFKKSFLHAVRLGLMDLSGQHEFCW